MYCSNCGNKINNTSDKYCTCCGFKLNKDIIDVKNNNEVSKNDRLKIVSIIIGIVSMFGTLIIIFAPFSLILSIVGLVLAICSLKKVKNVSGIIINSIAFVLSLIVSIFLLIFFVNMVDMVGGKSINWIHDFYNEHFNYPDEEHYGEKFKDIITKY